MSAWILAARPRTLPAAIAPVAVGSALAAHHGLLRPSIALAALLGAMLIQIGTNLANDLFDAIKGADTEARRGPRRAVASGLLSRRQVAWATGLSFLAATLVGISLVMAGGWPIVVLGLCSIAAGILYTGGPWPLGYHGLGDLCVFLFFGLVAVAGTVYVQGGRLVPGTFVCATAVGLLAAAIIVVNNVRDLDTDRRCGKRTLAVRLGRTGSIAEYAALMAAGHLAVLGGVLSGRLPRWALLAMLTAIPALTLTRRLARLVASDDAPGLNRLLERTAQLLALFALLLSLGIGLG